MRVYLDDDLDGNSLIAFLRQEGHAVISPRAVGTRGQEDESHFQYGFVLLTANVQDFVDLHHAWQPTGRSHAGIILVSRENNPQRDMTYVQIARAVSQLEQSGVPTAHAYHNLNMWRVPRF